jgi:hypothetical protein
MTVRKIKIMLHKLSARLRGSTHTHIMPKCHAIYIQYNHFVYVEIQRPFVFEQLSEMLRNVRKRHQKHHMYSYTYIRVYTVSILYTLDSNSALSSHCANECAIRWKSTETICKEFILEMMSKFQQ